jgi:hypothetical protein
MAQVRVFCFSVISAGLFDDTFSNCTYYVASNGRMVVSGELARMLKE